MSDFPFLNHQLIITYDFYAFLCLLVFVLSGFIICLVVFIFVLCIILSLMKFLELIFSCTSIVVLLTGLKDPYPVVRAEVGGD